MGYAAIRSVKVRTAKIVSGHPLLGKDPFFERQMRPARLAKTALASSPLLLCGTFIGVLNSKGLGFWVAPLNIFGTIFGQVLVASQGGPFYFRAIQHLKSIIWASLESKSTGSLTNANFIGVSFTSQIWKVNGQSSWDCGALLIDAEGIKFVGRKVSFGIERSLIQSVEIASLSFGRGSDRLYLKWKDDLDVDQFVCIEPLEYTSDREFDALVLKLRDDIQGILHPGKSSSMGVTGLPPKSSEMPLSQSDFLESSKLAKCLAGGIVVGLGILAFFVLERFLNLRLFQPPLWPLAVVVLAMIGNGYLFAPLIDRQLKFWAARTKKLESFA